MKSPRTDLPEVFVADESPEVFTVLERKRYNADNVFRKFDLFNAAAGKRCIPHIDQRSREVYPFEIDAAIKNKAPDICYAVRDLHRSDFRVAAEKSVIKDRYRLASDFLRYHDL